MAGHGPAQVPASPGDPTAARRASDLELSDEEIRRLDEAFAGGDAAGSLTVI